MERKREKSPVPFHSFKKVEGACSQEIENGTGGANRKFWREERVGDGVREEDAQRSTGLRLQTRGAYILGSNKGKQEGVAGWDYLAAKFKELFPVVL